MVALRALVRQREMLIRYRAAHIQQMNLKLTNVVSDITGVTGLAIIQAILAGEREPHQLARLRQPECKHSEVEFKTKVTVTLVVRSFQGC